MLLKIKKKCKKNIIKRKENIFYFFNIDNIILIIFYLLY